MLKVDKDFKEEITEYEKHDKNPKPEFTAHSREKKAKTVKIDG